MTLALARPVYPVGYQMIRSVEVRNFRSFDAAALHDCRKINVIVGENGSGKTALLEAIFLAAGPSPELALRTRSWRGYEGAQMSGTEEQIDRALWADLFHKFDVKSSAEITLAGDTEHNRSVEITFSEGLGPQYRLNRRARRAGLLVRDVPAEVEFKWEVPGREPVIVNPRLEDGQLKFGRLPETFVKTSFFAANRTYSGIETANRFSTLSRTFKEKPFIKMFNKHFPNIIDLSVEMSAGAAMLFAQVTDLPEKIPLSLASGGMNKLAAVLLAIPAQPGGVILVDEIENGIHYKRMPNIWQSLLDLAREHNSQVFVSTHSDECLGALADVANENPEEVSVISARTKDGASLLSQYSGEKFIAAMAENIEIR